MKRTILSLALLAALACGCSRTARPAPEAPGPQVLARLFGTYAGRNKGRPPATAEQLKKFAAGLKPDELSLIGIKGGGVDALFVSTRDNQPFVFRNPAKYGNTVGPETVVAYEQTGKDGKRVVIFGVGRTQEVDAAKLKELVPESGT